MSSEHLEKGRGMDSENLADVEAVAAGIRADRRRIRLGMALGAVVAVVTTVALYFITNELGVYDRGTVRMRTLVLPGGLGMLAGGAVYGLVSRRGNPFGN